MASRSSENWASQHGFCSLLGLVPPPPLLDKGAGAMDIMELVEAENLRIHELLSRLKVASGQQERRLLFTNVWNDLDRHFYAVQSVFYAAFRKYPDLAGMLKESEERVRDVLQMADRIRGVDYGSIDFENRVLELMNHFEDHLERERDVFLPSVRRLLRRPERERMGRYFKLVEHEKDRDKEKRGAA